MHAYIGAALQKTVSCHSIFKRSTVGCHSFYFQKMKLHHQTMHCFHSNQAQNKITARAFAVAQMQVEFKPPMGELA